MKNLIYRALLTALLAAGVLPLAAQTAGKEQMVVTLSNPGKPGVLHLKLVGGAIRVVGHSGKDVVVDMSTRGRSGRDESRSPEPPGGMRRISQAGGLDVTAQEKDNHVYLKTQSWQRPVDFTIKVPRQFSLQLSTVQDGDISVENVAGELEVSNVNGSIRLSDVAGSAVLSTVNGDVQATFRDVTPGAPMAFSTVNGKVDVTLPARAKAALKLKSDHGEIYSDFELAPDNSPAKVSRTAKEGTYRISQDNWTYGRINGGGAELMMKTLNGNIYIRKAK
ncbi:DUF4097 family beta strand repeat-containing protein [Hymenobacter sp. B81]|uniref:DUF4097 family beta strand repeat-containing protein n=1 Tax=Hymenobacter sp. B81 TaxID=3344878 RepID=UPI0037DCB090